MHSKNMSNLKQERLQKCKRKNLVATNNESGGWISCAKAGFIFDYTKEHSVPQRDDSSDEADSF